MATYGQYCPVARALDLVGDRWTLLIVRDMLAGGRRFNELERGLPGISRSLLAQRLRQLERGGILERRLGPTGRTREYRLTDAGRELEGLIAALRDWGARWAFESPHLEELDAAWLLWSMVQRLRREALPERRVVAEFRLAGATPPRAWLVLDRREGGSVCVQHPGFDVDLVVEAPAEAFFRAWLGRLGRLDAERCGELAIVGAPALERAFPGWFEWPALPPSAGRFEIRTSVAGPDAAR